MALCQDHDLRNFEHCFSGRKNKSRPHNPAFSGVPGKMKIALFNAHFSSLESLTR